VHRHYHRDSGKEEQENRLDVTFSILPGRRQKDRRKRAVVSASG